LGAGVPVSIQLIVNTHNPIDINFVTIFFVIPYIMLKSRLSGKRRIPDAGDVWTTMIYTHTVKSVPKKEAMRPLDF
jgi:hypothetical protein